MLDYSERYRVFRFEDIFSDRGQMQELAEHLGIDDLTITEEMLATKINFTKQIAGSFDDLTDSIKDWLADSCQPFVSRFYPEGCHVV